MSRKITTGNKLELVSKVETYRIGNSGRLLRLELAREKYSVYYTNSNPFWGSVLHSKEFNSYKEANFYLEELYHNYIDNPVRMEEKLKREEGQYK